MNIAITIIIRILLLIGIVLLIIGCSQRHFDYQTWDVDRNDNLDHYEFVNGYDNANCFRNWSRRNFAIPITQFTQNLFARADQNDDKTLDQTEFKTIADYFQFGFTHPSFTAWDNNANGYIDKNEFESNAEKTIGKMWDTSADQQLSLYEMSHGIYLTYDKNNNGSLDSSEFVFWVQNRLPDE